MSPAESMCRVLLVMGVAPVKKTAMLALACLLSAGAVGFVGDAWAHDIKPERHMALQLDQQGGAVLLHLRLTGLRAQVQVAMADLNRDGQLDPNERQLLAASLMQQALAGVQLWWNGVPVVLRGVSAEIEQVDAQGLLVGRALLTFVAEAAGLSEHELKMQIEQRYGPLTLQVQALGPWQLGRVSSGQVQPNKARLMKALSLPANSEFTARFINTNRPNPKAPGKAGETNGNAPKR